MPIVTFDVKRAGHAEQFVQNLSTTMPEALNELLEGIKSDIAANAPRGSGENPKRGDIKLSESFYTIPAQPVGEASWEGYIASRVPAKARAQNWGSGLYGPKTSMYQIPKTLGKMLYFNWPEGPNGERFPNHPWYALMRVMHPGVMGQYYIDETLRVWRPAIARKFGDAIRLASVSKGWMRGLL
jgi:hypothetical protein